MSEVEAYNHLHEPIVPLVKTGSKKQRIEYLDQPLWINHHVSNEILKLLNNLINRPQKLRMQSILLIAESNMGKTSLISQFAKMHSDYIVDDDEQQISYAVKPVIIAESPASADEKGLYISILEQFWTAFRPTDTNAKLRHQVMHMMRECHVKMLILDELHNLLGTTPVKQRKMMNIIKSLSNELKIPIVGVGTHDAALVLTTDPQHASRFDTVVIPRWEMDKNFRGLLAAFEKRLPLKKPSHLHSKEKAPLLLAISGGNIGNLHRLLNECCIYAIDNDVEEITVDIINHFKWLKPTDGKRPRELIMQNA
ncbi:MAG: TniB family NTP-binding protein [Hydrogenovibrio sp.]